MYQIHFQTPVHVHFIGIGGISMSGLAEILLEERLPVSGSDSRRSPLTDLLEEKGARIFIGQSPDNIQEGCDVVVYTAAIHEDNPEFARAKELGLPMLSRAQLLGQLMKNYQTAIAVAGTHGKTTTTSMISAILMKAEADPTISVGGMLPLIGGNIRVGKSKTFLTEACEYTNSFLSFHPTIGIILNIEEDHMDFFRDLNHIYDSFHRFAALLPPKGLLILNGEIDDLSLIRAGLSCRVVTCGTAPEDTYQAVDIAYDAMARPSFTLLKDGISQGRVALAVPGRHNVLNALAALALADELSISFETACQGLLTFSGTDRRFQYKGEVHGFTVVDDYAHHPTEITATLEAARQYPHREIWCVFQPHTYTRTKAFLKDFAKALSLSDHVVLADIYAARETDTLGISSETLLEELKALGVDAHYFPSFSGIENFLLKKCMHGDLCITMGAGDVVNIGENLISR